MANLQGMQQTILEELVNTMEPNPNREQWLRGQYYALELMRNTTFEELSDEDSSSRT